MEPSLANPQALERPRVLHEGEELSAHGNVN